MEVDGFDSLLEPSSRLQALPSCLSFPSHGRGLLSLNYLLH